MFETRKKNQYNLSLAILSCQPMCTASLAATLLGYLLHGSQHNHNHKMAICAIRGHCDLCPYMVQTFRPQRFGIFVRVRQFPFSSVGHLGSQVVAFCSPSAWSRIPACMVDPPRYVASPLSSRDPPLPTDEQSSRSFFFFANHISD